MRILICILEDYSRHPHVVYIEMLHFLDMFVDVDICYSASATVGCQTNLKGASWEIAQGIKVGNLTCYIVCKWFLRSLFATRKSSFFCVKKSQNFCLETADVSDRSG